MRCSRSLVCSASLLLVLAMFLGTPAFAQDPPDVAMGTSPSATYHGGEFDDVDMGTGRLQLTIPLVADHSQRGKLNFKYDVSYTGTGTWSVVNNGRTQLTEPPKYGVSGPALVQEGQLSGLGLQKYDDGIGDFYYEYTVDESYGVGGVHPLGNTTKGKQSIDGSGILIWYPPGSVLPNPIDKKGMILGGAIGISEDPNGNEITPGPGQCTAVGNESVCKTTDSLGRIWTTTSYSSDVTGCPTGGLVAPTSSTIWTIPGPSNVNSGVRNFKFCYSTYHIQTNFPNDAGAQYINTASLMTGIVLPDGTTWRFDYDNYSYGDLTAVYPPTGGHISYTWTTAARDCTDSNSGYGPWLRIVASRTVFDGVSSNTWNYNFSGSPSTVTDQTLGNEVDYYTAACVVTQIQYYSGSGSSGTLLKTVTKTYDNLPDPYPGDLNEIGVPGPQLLAGITTIWPNGQQSQVQYTYDSGFTFTDTNPNGQGTAQYTSSYGLVTSETHRDYGNGAPGQTISTATTNYLALANSSYAAANILDLPSSVTITDGNGNKCSETDYGYDEYSLDSSGVTEQHVAAPNSVMGNRTSVTRQYFTNPCSTPNPAETPYKTLTHYFDTGMKHTVTDPNNNITTYAYSGSFYGAYLTQTTMPSTASPNAANHIISGNYDFNTGLLTSFTDQNSNVTNFTYDVMLRPTNVTYPSPDGGQTNFYYANPTTVEMQKSIDGTRWTDSFIYYDGLGRESRSMSKNDETLPWDQVDTCYDANGRVGFKSYAYQGNGTSTPKVCSGAGDAFLYDPLNRTTQVTHSDNSTVLTSYAGRAASVQDEGNGTTRVQRISQVDGLGRMASVCEVSGATVLGPGSTPGACGQDIAGTGFLTTYTYNALNDLTGTSQGGYVPRSFTYDSLSRLLTSSNPEAGTMIYSYLNSSGQPCSGDLSLPCQRTSPKPSQTGSVTVTATMMYDQLNRLRTRNYANSDNSTTFLAPGVTYNYDETSALGVSGLLNTDGRSSSSSVAGSQAGEVFSYDKLGRIKTNSQCTPQNCGTSMFPMTYVTDLLGDVTSFTDGVGLTLSNTYNRALRVTQTTSNLSDSQHPSPLYSGVHYNAAGSVLAASFGISGANVNESRSYDGRLRLANITDGSLYSVTIPASGGYAPDSDILQALDSANGTWSYSYDEMNRLCNANHSATFPTCHTPASYNYSYDRFGNLWSGIGSLSVSFTGNNNRVDQLGSSYDAAGNLLNDGYTQYTYDSESRIVSATNSTWTVTYVYDANGRRVRKSTTTNGLIDYLFDLSGHPTTILNPTGTWNRGEIYAGGRHLGTYAAGTTFFTFADWLGTERARSTSTGALSETCTSNPFGDGLACAGLDYSPMHFTGKERDPESGLDNFGARYDSSQYGRFMTPDWSAKPQGVPYATFSNPQSLNLYAYVQNNPTTNRDADGHWCIFGKWGDTCSQPPPPPPPPPPAPPQFAKDNPTYQTPNQAMVAAARKDQQGQQQTGAENGNNVFGEPGAYTYTDPVTQGQKTTVDPNNTAGKSQTKPADLRRAPIPAGTDLAGEAHSHPDNVGFSGQDAQRAHDQTVPSNGHPSYQGIAIGLPNGNVVIFNPRTGQQTTYGPGYEPGDQ